MKEPVVISVANTATLTVSPTLSAVLGPALLVIDRNDLQPNAENFYIVARSSSLVDASGACVAIGSSLLFSLSPSRPAGRSLTAWCGRRGLGRRAGEGGEGGAAGRHGGEAGREERHRLRQGGAPPRRPRCPLAALPACTGCRPDGPALFPRRSCSRAGRLRRRRTPTSGRSGLGVRPSRSSGRRRRLALARRTRDRESAAATQLLPACFLLLRPLPAEAPALSAT